MKKENSIKRIIIKFDNEATGFKKLLINFTLFLCKKIALNKEIFINENNKIIVRKATQADFDTF